MRWRELIASVGCIATLAACAPTSTPSPTTADVSVSQVAQADQSAPCQDRESALNYYVNTDATTFELVINVVAPLCSPIDAKAVVYAMPNDGTSWPQELLRMTPFTLSEAGTTVVTFTRGCGVAQFDVITGASPQTIYTGLGHGPFLFPGDMNTAQQSYGPPCEGQATTTTASEPTTTTSTSTTVAPTTSTTSTTTTSTTTTTTSTTTTTVAPLPVLEYTGVADKTLGCYSGAGGDDTFMIDLGDNGWWHFFFQGCTTFSTETIALHDPPGGPFADAFQAPSGYQCRMSVDGTSDVTLYYTNQIGSVADTGGLVFLSSSSAWSSPTTWRITCVPL